MVIDRIMTLTFVFKVSRLEFRYLLKFILPKTMARMCRLTKEPVVKYHPYITSLHFEVKLLEFYCFSCKQLGRWYDHLLNNLGVGTTIC